MSAGFQYWELSKQIVSCPQQWDVEKKKSHTRNVKCAFEHSLDVLLGWSPVTRKVSNKAKIPDRLRDEPLGDTAPASHGDATAAAPTALPVRPPRVPVVSTGSLKTENPQTELVARNHVSALYLALQGSYRERWHHQQVQDQHRQRYLHPFLRRGKKGKRSKSLWLKKAITHSETVPDMSCLRHCQRL